MNSTIKKILIGIACAIGLYILVIIVVAVNMPPAAFHQLSDEAKLDHAKSKIKKYVEKNKYNSLLKNYHFIVNHQNLATTNPVEPFEDIHTYKKDSSDKVFRVEASANAFNANEYLKPDPKLGDLTDYTVKFEFDTLGNIVTHTAWTHFVESTKKGKFIRSHDLDKTSNEEFDIEKLYADDNKIAKLKTKSNNNAAKKEKLAQLQSVLDKNEMDIDIQLKKWVRANLNFPETADFPYEDIVKKSSVVNVEKGILRTYGTVKATNAFNVPIKIAYQIDYALEGNNISLVDIQMQE